MWDIWRNVYANMPSIEMLGVRMSVPALVFLSLLMVVFIIILTPVGGSRGVYRRGRFMTANEKCFFFALERALGAEYRISAQVRLGDLVDVEPRLQGAKKQAALNRILCKSVDFVICSASTLDPVAAVEVDDRTHLLPVRRERDVFVDRVFAEIGVPLVRAPASRTYSVLGIRKLLADAGVGGGWEPAAYPQAGIERRRRL